MIVMIVRVEKKVRQISNKLFSETTLCIYCYDAYALHTSVFPTRFRIKYWFFVGGIGEGKKAYCHRRIRFHELFASR